MMRRIIRDFSAIVRLGPVQTAGQPPLKCGCRGNFSFSRVFPPLKIRKSLPKNFIKKLRRVRSQFVIGSVDHASDGSSPLLANKRHAGRNAGNSAATEGHGRMSKINVRFTPKSAHWNSVAKCPLCAKSGHSRDESRGRLYEEIETVPFKDRLCCL